QMYPNLVRSAGARMNPAKRVAAETLDHLVVAARLLAVFLFVENGHLHSVLWVPADPAFDVVAIPVEGARRDGDVLLEDFAALELVAQVTVRLLILGYENHAAGVAIQPMDDTRPMLAADVAELAEAELQSVHERPAPVPFGGVHDHVGRLVDRRQELVLVQHLQRNVFSSRQIVGWLGQANANPVPVPNAVAGLGRMAVHMHHVGVNCLLYDGAAVTGKSADKILVQPNAFRFSLDR